MQIVNQIVDRLHVGAGKLEVIRYVISRMQSGYKTFKAVPKASRRDIIKQALARHKSNQELYQYVMGGTK